MFLKSLNLPIFAKKRVRKSSFRCGNSVHAQLHSGCALLRGRARYVSPACQRAFGACRNRLRYHRAPQRFSVSLSSTHPLPLMLLQFSCGSEIQSVTTNAECSVFVFIYKIYLTSANYFLLKLHLLTIYIVQSTLRCQFCVTVIS